jgi:hypothetical protein
MGGSGQARARTGRADHSGHGGSGRPGPGRLTAQPGRGRITQGDPVRPKCAFLTLKNVSASAYRLFEVTGLVHFVGVDPESTEADGIAGPT